jgi:hypothetical protein
MKKLLVLVAVAFAVIGGAATVMTFHPQLAQACDGSGCN